jgi:hypothetical protein
MIVGRILAHDFWTSMSLLPDLAGLGEIRFCAVRKVRGNKRKARCAWCGVRCASVKFGGTVV